MKSEVRSFARRVLADVLFTYYKDSLKVASEQASLFLHEAEIVVDVLKKETETLPLLEQRLLDYPVFRSSLNLFMNSLENLLCIWSVRGYSKQKPILSAELLIGEYRTMPYVAPLGRRVGLRWVSPVVE